MTSFQSTPRTGANNNTKLPWVLTAITQKFRHMVLEDPKSLPELTYHAPKNDSNNANKLKPRLRRLDFRQNLVNVATLCFKYLDLHSMIMSYYDPNPNCIHPPTLKEIAQQTGVCLRTVIRVFKILQNLTLQWFDSKRRKPIPEKDESGWVKRWIGRASIRRISSKLFHRLGLGTVLAQAQKLAQKRLNKTFALTRPTLPEVINAYTSGQSGRPAARPAEPRPPGLNSEPVLFCAQDNPDMAPKYVDALRAGNVTEEYLRKIAAKTKYHGHAETIYRALTIWANR